MRGFLIVFLFCLYQIAPAQVIPAGFPVLEERARLNQLITDSDSTSFLIRPILNHQGSEFLGFDSPSIAKKSNYLTILPALSTFRVNTKRPYGFGDYGMIPTPGAQFYLSGGIHYQFKELGITLYPDFVLSQNSKFDGFLGFDESLLDFSRFRYWNLGDNPERFGSGNYYRVSLGQSRISYGFKSFELAIANQNIWWGPGQFNSLTFSNNTPGFPMLTIGTRKPAKTFLGNFEVQIMSGILNTTRLSPTQSDSLNMLYYKPRREKDRYVNGLVVSYNPKWVKGLYIGGTRTVQTFTDSVSSSFQDVLPVFLPVTKSAFGSDLIGESDKGKSQQITIFGRYLNSSSGSEIYFEFGRRDHALNWREFILSPEHARGYIIGFNQMFNLKGLESKLLIRGEITHQQESVNRYIRYIGLGGGTSWHTNGSIGGITHFGQPTGVGIGTGSNIQTLEFSKIDGFNKTGVFFERLDNTVDYYYKVQFQDTERKPWVDLSLGFLYDKQVNNLLISSKLQVIHARNYQWQLDPSSTPDFPKGKNLTSMMAQVSLIYLWNKNLDK
uniref:capsule assembly Wzi family protein n=1 Tax=Algoriphagus locisalis TaxID=305507 RepID=UPI000AE75E79|nr:capsule assembly Wzi family protein [Algoriphagus locisalis]